MPAFAEFILLAVLWGASFLLMKLGVAGFGPVATAFVRVSVAALILLPLLLWRGLWPETKKHAGVLALVAIFNTALPFALFSFAMQSVPSGYGGILNATAPLWTALLGWAFFQQASSRSVLIGLALGFVGVLIISWPRIQAAGAQQSVVAWGFAACLAATFCYGLAANLSRKYLSQTSAMTNAAGTQIASAFFLAPLAALYWPQTAPHATHWLALIALGIFCTALAYIIFFRIMTRQGPAAAVSVTFLIPVFALFYGWLFLNETITLYTIAGGAIVLLGTALVTGVMKTPKR